MRTVIVQEESECSESSIIDFLLKNIDGLKFFIRKMNEDFGQRDLVFMIKMFVLNQNKVFDMASYMKRQSEIAGEYVKEYNKRSTRRAAQHVEPVGRGKCGDIQKANRI